MARFKSGLSLNMTPRFTSKKHANGGDRNAIFYGDLIEAQCSAVDSDDALSGLRAQGADFQNFAFGENMATMLGSALCWLAQNINRVALILGSGHIFEIFKAVISRNPIFVVHFVRWGACTTEGEQYQLMDPIPLPGKTEAPVSSLLPFSDQDPLSMANAPLIAHFIVRISRYRTPFFHGIMLFGNRRFANA